LSVLRNHRFDGIDAELRRRQVEERRQLRLGRRIDDDVAEPYVHLTRDARVSEARDDPNADPGIRGALPHLRNLQLVIEFDPVGLDRRSKNVPEHPFHRRGAGVPESEEVEVSRHTPLQVPDVEQPRALEDEAVRMRGAGQTVEEALRREPNEDHVEVRVRLLREPQETRVDGGREVRRRPPRRTHEMIASR
jgi:hypothetical protein